MAVHSDLFSLFVKNIIGRASQAGIQIRDKWKGQNEIVYLFILLFAKKVGHWNVGVSS